jgi:hypothetical protein
MSTPVENFKLWYADIIRGLYSTRDAGFVIVLVTFPLLERYVRQKTDLSEDHLKPRFYKELVRLFPVLENETSATEFWNLYRNKLLHIVTSKGWLSHDLPASIIIDNGKFKLHPVEFAKQVLKIIEDDFTTFEGTLAIREVLSRPTHDTRERCRCPRPSNCVVQGVQASGRARPRRDGRALRRRDDGA